MKVQLVLVCVLMASVSLANAGTVTLFDGTFNDADWEVSSAGSSRGGGSGSQVPVGGNSGAFRRVVNSNGGGGGLTNAWHFYVGMAYDPSVDGAIETLDYSEDTLAIAGSNTVSRVILRQDGLLYQLEQTYLAGPSSSEWVKTNFTGLTATDFALWFNGTLIPTGDPDFSEAGSPIEFGFFRTQSFGVFGGAVQTGIDNWQVEITVIPEPTSLLLVITATGVVLGLRRKRVA